MAFCELRLLWRGFYYVRIHFWCSNQVQRSEQRACICSLLCTLLEPSACGCMFVDSGKQNVVRFLRYFATCMQLHWKQGCAPCRIRANLPNCRHKVENFEVVVYHLVSMWRRSCKGCLWELHWTVKCYNKDSEDYITPRDENKGPGSLFPVHEVWLCVLHGNGSPCSATYFKG